MHRRTAHCLAGLSRGSGAGQTTAQAARASSPSFSSSSTSNSVRSTAVIASLLRMRAQFHRLRHPQQQQVIAAVLAKRREASGLRTPPSSASATATEAVLAAVTGPPSNTSKGSSTLGSASSAAAAALAVQTGVILCSEAQRLLNSEVRGEDPLSDVPPESASFAVEAGKALHCAATFGATTTFVRVRRVLLWVGEHKEALQTPRQVMSLCMPLLNLSDGPTAGVAFVLTELYEPLLLSLQSVAAADAPVSTTAAGEAAGDSSGAATAVQQHFVAITSAMSMLVKWAAMRTGGGVSAREAPVTTATGSAAPADATPSPATATELEQMLRIAEASVAAVRRQVDGADRVGPDASYEATQYVTPTDALQWLLALHGLERLYTSTGVVSAEDTAAATRRIALCHRALLPLLRRILDGSAAARTSGGSGGNASAAAAAAAAAAAPFSGLRVHDALELLQLSLQPSVEPTHLDLALTYALQALPSTLSTATVKDLSALAQAVNKARQRRPSAVPAPVLLALLASLRPALFLLRETHARQLRAQDCSFLLTALSRWEEVPGVTLSSDIVELLSQCIGEQLHVVGLQQLLPFVLTVARLEAAHAQPGGTTGPQYRFATTPRVLAHCAQRAVVLAAKDGAAGPSTPTQTCMSATDAANLLTSFVQLSVPHCADFFAAVEPMLADAVRGNASASTPASAAIRQRVAVEDALRRFAAQATSGKASRSRAQLADTAVAVAASAATASPQDGEAAAAAAAAARASALVGDTTRGLAALMQEAESPKALVMASALVRRHLLRGRTTEAPVRRVGEGDEAAVDGEEAEQSGVTPRRRIPARRRRLRDVRLASAFAAAAVRLAPRCNGLEAATLASTTAQLCSAGLCPPSAAHGVLRVLWVRCGTALAAEPGAEATLEGAAEPFSLTLSHCKALMDASRVVRFAGAAPPVAFLQTTAALCEEASRSAAARLCSTARGTAHAYAEAVAKLRTATGLGRSMVSYIAPLLRAASATEADDARPQTAAWQAAWAALLRAYLDVVQSAMAAYAAEATLAETWWVETQGVVAPTVPLELLSTTAGVTVQVYRLVRQRGDAGRLGAEDAAEPAVRPLDDNAELDAGDAEDHTAGMSSAPADTAAAEATVRGILGLLGDTIVTLAQQRQRLTPATATSPPELDEGDAAEAHGLVQDPKHLLMLLQAFETAQCPHPGMLYSVLPELRGCADRLDPLALSLLVRALNELGAWNSRLLHVLAAAVEAKMDQCPLRQCYTLLRGLCRSGCASADTYVELRAAPRPDWSATPGRQSGGSLASQAPLQRLTEAALRRLDTLVRAEHDFMRLSQTASAADLVGAVGALQFFHAPPPATYDAFVVLAVHALSRPACRLPARETLQHAIALLGAVAELRQPAQQRVSAQALWAVIHGALASPAPQAAAALHLHTCWELTRYAAEHSLRYGREATADFFRKPLHASAGPGGEAVVGDGGAAAPVAVVRERLDRLLAERVPGADSDARVSCTAAEAHGLRRYALHCAPSLARGDRDIVPYVCDPLRLAQLATQNSTGALLYTAATTSPAAQARRGVRLMACLVRGDVWCSPRCGSAATAAANRRLTASAMQQLWSATSMHALLARAPAAFSTEELLVLAAGAQLVCREVPGTSDFEADYAVAVQQLCASTTEWRFAAAVDAWVLFGLPLAEAAAPGRARADEHLLTMLTKSGTVLVSTFAHAQRTWCSTSGARLLPELLRLFHGGGQLDTLLRHPDALDAATLPPAEGGDDSAAARYAAVHRELLRCFAWCLDGHFGATTSSPVSQ